MQTINASEFNVTRFSTQSAQRQVFCLLALLLLAATSPGAFAQSEQRAPTSVMEEITVTGSRIARRDFTANSPIVSMDASELNTFGAIEVEEKLNQLPQFLPGETQFDSGVTGGSRGRSSLNLRGLTSTRNLVLLDGKRAQPTGANMVIDVNTIPSSLIDRVEIITGGSSAAYGSDAMSGVVNFILKKDFEGVEAGARYGFTEHGGGANVNVDLALGYNFADGKGNAVLSFNYFDRNTLRTVDRDYFRRGLEAGFGGTDIIEMGQYNPSLAGPIGPSEVDLKFFLPFGNQPSLAAYQSVFGPSVVSNRTKVGFNNDGTIFTQNNGDINGGILNYRGPTDRFGVTADGKQLQYYQSQSESARILAPTERWNAFTRVDYELTSNISLFGQGMITNSDSVNFAGGSRAAFNVWDMIIPVTNPFIPPDLATLLASRPNPTADFGVTKEIFDVGTRKAIIESQLFQAMIGLEGNVPGKDWTWEAYASHGETHTTDTRTGSILYTLLEPLLFAPDGGDSMCAGGFNPFGLNVASDECIDLVTRNFPRTEAVEQDIVEATLQGGLLELPAGELRFAAGADWRENTVITRIDTIVNSGGTSSDVLTTSPSLPTEGKINVWEVFGELLVPLLNDLPGIYELSANLGYRYSDYNTSGGASTYKGDLSWTVTPEFRLRGGYQRANRAPNIGELFGGSVGGAAFIFFPFPPFGQGDPCDIRNPLNSGPDAAQVRALCIAQGMSPTVYDNGFTFDAPIVSGQNVSNPELKPEKADTFTAGFVWQPQFEHALFERVSFTADYYNIDIADAVSPIDGVDALRNCYNANNRNPTFDPNNVFCSQVFRAPVSGVLSLLKTVPVNSGGIKTQGVDLQFDWGFDLAKVSDNAIPGSLDFNFTGTYLDSFKITALEGEPTLDFAGTIDGPVSPLPKWRFNLTPTYSLGNGALGLRWRYLSSMDSDSAENNPANVLPGVSSYSILDLFARWSKDRYELRAGIDNLTDKQPLDIDGVPGNTNQNTYDPLGRRFYFAASVRFD